jgi:hypothetical protein
VTLVGLAAAALWLRRRVAGRCGTVAAPLLAALLAMNMPWLFGFTSFLLGACLFPITLGVWWEGRDRLSAVRITALAVLLVLAYFCHLVSAGLTVVGLVILSLASPFPDGTGRDWPHWLARLVRTCASFIPLAALGLLYVQIARRGGSMHPSWYNLPKSWSPADWETRLGWVDPITLAIKVGLPFTERAAPVWIVLSPVLWLTGALICWWYGRAISGRRTHTHAATGEAEDAPEPPSSGVAASRRDQLAWILLAGLLILGGLIGPDSLGPAHGEFLPQRLVLLGLVALVPTFDVDAARWSGRATVAALAIAVIVQSAIVWDYARYCDQSAGQIIRAGDLVGRDQRIATVLVTTRSRFRANPLLHAENWLGVDTHNIVWNNYETLHYYFPVQFKPGIDRPFPGDLELLSLQENPPDGTKRLRVWTEILSRHADSIDAVLIWKRSLPLEEITKCWFDLVERRGDVQVFHRRRVQSRE